MRNDDQTAAEHQEKREALNRAHPLPAYEPDLRYQHKGFGRSSKSYLRAKPNHLGSGLKAELPGGF